MVYFPSVNAVKASFDPNNASKYWIQSSGDKSLSTKAEEELKNAANKVAPKAGIEMFSPEFYAACTFGGAMGMYILR